MPRHVLEVQGVHKSFSGLRALDDISFSVLPAQIKAIIGPNGAGKTTLFNLISGLLPADSGTISFAGTNLATLPSHRIAGLGVARTFQTVRLFRGLSVVENVMVGSYRHARAGFLAALFRLPSSVKEHQTTLKRALEYLDQVGLSSAAHERADLLPFGRQRLLELARALALQPKLLLLDEPASGLNDRDTENLAELIRTFPSMGITVLLVEHNMRLVMNVAEDILVLDSGKKLAEGTPDLIQAHAGVIAAYLGAPDDAT